MHQKRYSRLHSLIQRLASTALVARLAAPILPHIDRTARRLLGRPVIVTNVVAGLPTLLLTTTGAKSGLPRTVPLVYIRDPHDPRRLALIATNWGQERYPAWYFNLKAHPQARCEVAGVDTACTAHETSGAEYDRFWELAAATYRGFPRYRERIAERRHIPIMVLTLA